VPGCARRMPGRSNRQRRLTSISHDRYLQGEWAAMIVASIGGFHVPSARLTVALRSASTIKRSNP
jgi:hypothetical protein